MSDNSGWYLLHRGWMENPVFKQKEFCQRMAWIWLIDAASWKETKIRINGKTIELKRGQLSYSRSYLSKVWGWNESRVRRFINALKTDQMIELKTDQASDQVTDQANDQGQWVITICNYDKYQRNRPSVDQASDQVTDQASDHNKKESFKEIKEEERGVVQIAFELWNELAARANLAKAQRLTGTRISRLAARLQETGGIEGWKFALEKIEKSSFLRGENKNGWKADLDFMLQQSSFTKLMEGSYDDKKPNLININKPQKKSFAEMGIL